MRRLLWTCGLLGGTSCGLPPGTHQSTVVESIFTGSAYEVRTFVPESVADPTTAAQVVVLDGDWHALPAFVEAGRDGHPPVVIVSIGYEGPNERIRDLTPTEVEGAGGGLEAFADALEQEILPERAGSATDRILFGHSLGGLAVTHLWATRPALAPAVIAASPAYHWDEAIVFDTVGATDATGPVFLTHGGQEGHGIPELSAAMDETLGSRASHAVYPAREHTDTVAPSLRDGLATLLRGN